MDEAEARRILSPSAQELVGVVEKGWANMVAEGRPRSRRARAGIVYDYMIAEANSTLVGRAGVRRIERQGISMYVFDKRLVVRFKMHNRKFRTANVPTRHQMELANQVGIPGLPSDVVNVTCGYTLDIAEASIEKVVVVKHIRFRRDWVIDLRELATGQLLPTTPALPLVTPSPATLPTIQPAERPADSGPDPE